MMQTEKNPFFRKAITPWYDTDIACIIKSVVMLVLAIFGLDGITVARKMEACTDYIWVPLLVLVLSGIVFITNVIRLARRHTGNSAI